MEIIDLEEYRHFAARRVQHIHERRDDLCSQYLRTRLRQRNVFRCIADICHALQPLDVPWIRSGGTAEGQNLWHQVDDPGKRSKQVPRLTAHANQLHPGDGSPRGGFRKDSRLPDAGRAGDYERSSATFPRRSK